MEMFWLGYDGLHLPYQQIVAVLRYHPALDRSIRSGYGHVPIGVQAVVVSEQGYYLPARWSTAQIRAIMANWRQRQVSSR